MQIAPAVCAMPSIISTPGNTGLAGKWPMELRLVEGDVLDADRRLVAVDLDDAVDHQERIAVRQQLQDLLDVGRLERRRRSFIRSRPPSVSARAARASRSQQRNVLAATRAPAWPA